jgi:DNA-binding CsgD family transcriptional regulator
MKRSGNARLFSGVRRNTAELMLHRNRPDTNRKAIPVVPDRPVRGREAELGRIARSLDAVANGRGEVVLVEGARGSGKSRLLAEAARSAAERGFDVAGAEANELLRLVPLAPLFTALGEPQPVHNETSHAFDGLDDRWSRQLAHLRGRLVRRVTERPLLIALDDLQWADPASLLALRILPTQLAGHPILWLFGRSTDNHDAHAAQLCGHLRSSGMAASLELGPLTAPAADEMVADLLGATPAPEVNSLVGAADGNPAVLAELVDGLVDEGAVACSDGTARLVSRGAAPLLPQRFSTLVQHRIGALSPPTARMLEVAAVLGRSWLPDDVVEMLGTSAAELLPSFQEALAARLLVSTSDTMAFRHDLVWQSITESIPPPVRAALHRQAARMLLDRGSSIVSVALHLARGARPQDVDAVRVLKDAATEVMGSSPRTAVDLASRGLELMDRNDPTRLDLTAVLVEALTRVGALGRAIRLAREALPSEQTTSLCQWLSTALLLNGEAREAFAVAGKALEATGITAGARGVLELNQVAALGLLGDAALEDAAARCTGHRAGALTALAGVRWRQGRFDEGLRLARDALLAAEDGSPVPWHLDPRVVLAAMLVQSRRADEAKAVITALGTHITRSGLDVLASLPHLLHAQAHLIAGQLDEAQARAQAALSAPVSAHTPIASGVLAAVAVRRGDLVTAGEHAKQLAGRRPPLWQDQLSWLHALITGQVPEELPGPALLVEEPAAAAWFVRTALACGDHDRATAVLRGLTGDTVAVDHARGVRDHDPAALARAAEHHLDEWSRASAAEDLAVLLTTDDREAAVERLDEALAGYSAAGAERDAARARRRLRGLGVRRRHWRNADRPASGWASLTDAEHNVAGLVIRGLTNKQVATQMFLSPHTVGFHLRQIFRKLDIHSRTELTRFDPEGGSTR